MNLRWIYGTFGDGQAAQDGSISEANILAHILGSDTVKLAINPEDDNATLSVSARDMPPGWRELLRPWRSMVALVDLDAAWDDDWAILYAGPVLKLTMPLNGRVQIQVAGLAEYLNHVYVANKTNGVITDPTENIEIYAFGGGQPQLMYQVAQILFRPTATDYFIEGWYPPEVLWAADFRGQEISESEIMTVRPSDFQTYQQLLQKIRDERSNFGTEYRFHPRWFNEDKTSIRWMMWIGGDSSLRDAHINEEAARTVQIQLDDANDALVLAYAQAYDGSDMATRMVGQSKTGEIDEDKGTGKGADFTTRVLSSGERPYLPLLDQAYQPDVELSETRMEAQLVSRLRQETMNAAVTYTEAVADPRTWLERIGARVKFKGSQDANALSYGFGIEVRTVSVTFSSRVNKVEVETMLPQPRYPRLPRAKKADPPKAVKPKTTPQVGTAAPKRPIPTTLPGEWSAAGDNGNSQLAIVGGGGGNFAPQLKGEIHKKTIQQQGRGINCGFMLTTDGNIYGYGDRARLSVDASIAGNPVMVGSVEVARYVPFPVLLDPLNELGITQLLGADGRGSAPQMIGNYWLEIGGSRTDLITAKGTGRGKLPSPWVRMSHDYFWCQDGNIWRYSQGDGSQAIEGDFLTQLTFGTNYRPDDLTAAAAANVGNGTVPSGYGLAWAHGTDVHVRFFEDPSRPELPVRYRDEVLPLSAGIREMWVTGANYGEAPQSGNMNLAAHLEDGTCVSISMPYAPQEPGKPSNIVITNETGGLQTFEEVYRGHPGWWVARDTEGDLYVKGDNGSGQLGIGGNSPVQDFTKYVTSSRTKPGMAISGGYPGYYGPSRGSVLVVHRDARTNGLDEDNDPDN